MTTLLIQTMSVPLTVNLPAIKSMSVEQFYEFCLANRDLRIERTANGEVIIMPPAFSDTGNRNFKIALQLGNWAEQDGTGETFDSSAGFTLPSSPVVPLSSAKFQLTRLLADWQSLLIPVSGAWLRVTQIP